MTRCLFICCLLLAAASHAEDLPLQEFIEVSVEPKEVPVGEPVTLKVSVFVPTWFADPPRFPSFELPNAITRLPPNSSRSTSKRVGRDTWSGITRNYVVYPLLGARFRLDSETIELRYANPGGEPIAVQAQTGDITFAARVPAGAESLDPYVAGTRFELDRNVDGNTDKLEVGDAVVVTYTAELDGLSAIFIPELMDVVEMPGISVYADQALIEEGPPARRSERLTFVFNAGGEFDVPGLSIDWWNTATGVVETASIPAAPFAVDGPASDATFTDRATPMNWRLVVTLILGGAVSYWLARTHVAALCRRMRQKEELRRASEPYAWKRATKALHGDNARRAHDEIVLWLNCLDTALDSRKFAAWSGDAKLQRELETLSRNLFASSGETADLGMIARGLENARARYLADRARSFKVALPPLNP